MDFKPLLFKMWDILIHHGIALAALLVLAILVPRAGRLTLRLLSRKLAAGEESTKASLALVGALVYVLQAVAYFVIIMLALTNIGVPPMGAAIPATVVSAAVGFGAQSVIGDFLSGFFIISERQFGMGDFVSFDGTSNPVEGTVVGLTLRATKIRTPSGEVVTVPNGSAGVITNYSQEWSRAVVDMEVPIQPGESMKDLVHEIKTATHRALSDRSVRADITGELEILPAMSVTAPAVAGQPWTVTTRIIVEVNPARQWAVERVIRAALLNTFWHRYEQAPDLLGSGTATQELPAAEEPSFAHDATDGLHSVANSGGDEDGPGQPTHPKPEESPEVVPTSTETTSEATSEEKVQEALSVGGRVRSSTTLLIVALLVLGLLALFSSNPEGGDAGFLNPDRYRSSSSASVEETTTPTTENAETSEPATAETDSSYTTEPAPTQQPQQQPTAENTPQTGNSAPSQTQSEQGNTSAESDAIATEPQPTD